MKQVILGICAYNHDSSACLIIEGKFKGFYEEERFTGQKNTGSLPKLAISSLLKKNNLSSEDITDIAFYFDIKLLVKSYLKNNNPISWILYPYRFFSFRFIYEFFWMVNFILKAYRIPKQLNANNAKITFYPHHDCHIWYAIYASRESEGIVISNDSIGEEICSIAKKWYKKDNGEIKVKTLFKQYSPHSIGYIYGAVTEKLGYNRQNGAGKVMALASFCRKRDASYFTEKLALYKNGTFKFKQGLVMDRSYKPAAKRLHKTLLLKHPISNSLDETHYSIAYGVQKLTENIIEHQVKNCVAKSKNIVLTGGVAQNSVVNGIIANKYSNNNIIVPPIPGDSGCSIGSALLCSHKKNKKLPRFVDAAFQGSAYKNSEVVKFLKDRSINYNEYRDLDHCLENVTSYLINGKVVGVFNENMECGPRALGNRSILALPTIKNITKHLNKNIKYRESFRPYGVIICESKLHDYFIVSKNIKKIPYMTHVFKIHKNYEKRLKNVVHIDGTCRVQTIGLDNKFYIKLFDLLEELGEARIIINTSLNVMGQPICRNISHALACFFTSGLDYIIFNNKIVISKNDN